MYFVYSHTKTTCNKVGRSEDPFYPLPDIAIVNCMYLKSPANTFPIIKSSTTSRYFTLPSLLRIQSYQMTYSIHVPSDSTLHKVYIHI